MVVKTQEDMLARLKDSIALKKKIMADAEQRTVAYYEEFFQQNGHRVKLAQ